MAGDENGYAGVRDKYRGTLDRVTPAVIAILVIIGGFGFIFYYPDRDSSAVVGLMMLILGYYFGSSKGSSDKNKILEEGVENNEELRKDLRIMRLATGIVPDPANGLCNDPDGGKPDSPGSPTNPVG